MGPAGAPRLDAAVVRMEGMRRRFGETVALDGARLSLTGGEVHAVLGANGAGKTTLLSVLAGLIQPDAGRILLRGIAVRPSTPREAWALGIGMVHQHFTLVPRLSVVENLALGSSGATLRLGAVRERAAELISRTGLAVPMDARVEALGVGERQRVEVLKVLLRAPGVLILDEPTAVLAPVEVERLLLILRSLASGGTTVVLVAHKLDEVLSVADRVTVLREGRTVLEAERSAVDAAVLVEAMVGSLGTDVAAEVVTVAAEVAAEVVPVATAATPQRAPTSGETVARLDGVSVVGAHGEAVLGDVTLEVRRGEVVGVAGVEGNGQRELAQLLAGRLDASAGTVALPPDPSFIPQDRSREGLIPDFTLTENVALALHREPEYRRGPVLRWGPLRERTLELLDTFSVRPPLPEARARALSGGNQQRVVVARELGRDPDLLVAENPTRGLDVRAAAFVHRRLRELSGAGIVLISTDLDEVLRLSDRVFVMVRGRLLEVPAAARTREGVGRMMLGGTGAGG
jgi:general nucleoside transport system ATP-binding protein